MKNNFSQQLLSCIKQKSINLKKIILREGNMDPNIHTLSNVSFQSGRTRMPGDPNDAKSRGIETYRNVVSKWLAELFGAKTIEVKIEGETRYLDKRSCYNLVSKLGDTNEEKEKFIKKSDKDILALVQAAFDKVINPPAGTAPAQTGNPFASTNPPAGTTGTATAQTSTNAVNEDPNPVNGLKLLSLRDLAASGDADAQYNLGMYLLEVLPEPDPINFYDIQEIRKSMISESIKNLELACEQNHILSLAFLGGSLSHNNGNVLFPPDYEKGYKYMERLASLDTQDENNVIHPAILSANFFLGQLYHEGFNRDGINKVVDKAAALKYFAKAQHFTSKWDAEIDAITSKP
jgi:hypothetical protein